MITVLEIDFFGGPCDGLSFAYTSESASPVKRVREDKGGLYILKTVYSLNGSSRFAYVWERLNITPLGI